MQERRQIMGFNTLELWIGVLHADDHQEVPELIQCKLRLDHTDTQSDEIDNQERGRSCCSGNGQRIDSTQKIA